MARIRPRPRSAAAVWYPRTVPGARPVARLAPPAITIGLLVIAAGCAAPIERANGFRPVLSGTTVRLHHHDLPLHLSAGPTRQGPLVVYATGDGGWIGGDEEIFNKLVPWGHPVAGFSARDYVHHLDGRSAIEPDELADDYAAIIAAADLALGLPLDTRVVLVGKSRGAGLQMVAADPPRLRPILQGVLGLGFTREEEFAHVRSTGDEAGPWTMVQLYDLLPHFATVPIVVIQSTRDQYVPSAEGRVLFGPDTPTRQFIEIDAANHDFAGALPSMYSELHRALDWLCAAR
jgi:hypothetical protein